MSFFEPSPVLLAFIFVQRFVFFEILAVISLLRLWVGRGAARLPALVTLAICAIAIGTTFAPALQWQTHPAYPSLATTLTWYGGAGLPFLTALIFATSWLFPARAWRWIDICHACGVVAFAGLWLWTKV